MPFARVFLSTSGEDRQFRRESQRRRVGDSPYPPLRE